MFLLVLSVKNRLVHVTKTKCDVTIGKYKTKIEKAKCDLKQQIGVYNTKVMAIIEPKVKQLKTVVEPKYVQLKSKVTPKVDSLMKTTQYKKACEMASKGLTFSVQTCEKIIGKDKTKSFVQAIETRIPAYFKAAAPAPVKK